MMIFSYKKKKLCTSFNFPIIFLTNKNRYPKIIYPIKSINVFIPTCIIPNLCTFIKNYGNGESGDAGTFNLKINPFSIANPK